MKKSELFSELDTFFRRFQGNAKAANIQEQFLLILKSINVKELCFKSDDLISIYERAVILVENEASGRDFHSGLLSLQSGLYAELENILLDKKDNRHHFLIVIPVADRPVMLKSCIKSLAEQCRNFQYGGYSLDSMEKRLYRKVSLFIIDDSRDPGNIRKIRDLCSETISEGIRTYYFGLKEQTELLNRVPSNAREQLRDILGDYRYEAHPHKGASVSRNIAYLYLNAFLEDFPERALIYFLDSDEEFRVKIRREGVVEDISFINYFYWLDKLFSTGEIEIATGKVVGDPPVSPSVMISTFMEDISLFLETISEAAPDQRCIFHADEPSQIASAEYHDMAGLFGYKGLSHPRRYCCSLSGDHTVRACLDDFSKRAIGFFHGLHPTRSQLYQYCGDYMKTTAARTVYTGNYVFSPTALRHFIPFANLKLRMAGPSLGRILRERLGQRFVTVDLPLLHKRTTEENYGNEFRSGIEAANGSIDVSLEFNKQFWGDIMLFTIEKISASGYPASRIMKSEITAAANEIQGKLWNIYKERQNTVTQGIANLRKFLSSDAFPWHKDAESKRSMDLMEIFCSLAEKNFGSDSTAMKKIAAEIEDGSVLRELIDAINSFYKSDTAWQNLLQSPMSLTQLS